MDEVRRLSLATASIREQLDLHDNDRRACNQGHALTDARLRAIEEALVVLDARLELVLSAH